MSNTFVIDPKVLTQSQVDFLDMTHKLNDWNEMQNVNNHLKRNNEIEIHRLTAMNNQVKTKVMKMKQDYLLSDFAIHELSLYINTMMFTIIVVSVALIFVARAKGYQSVLWILIGLGIFYLIVLIFILKSNVNRRKYAWDQWYWAPIKK